MTTSLGSSGAVRSVDVVLVGGGIMSATLGAYLKQLEPEWDIDLYERLAAPGLESSAPWNNAGTGHSALCELNYTPQAKDGSVSPEKALSINEQFQVTRQFLSYFVENGHLKNPRSFINSVPHMSFVHGEDHAQYLKTRYDALVREPLFEAIEYSEDPDQIGSWAPLLTEGRDKAERIAASRVAGAPGVAGGTDVNFGSLTRELIDYASAHGTTVKYQHDVHGLQRTSRGTWQLEVKDRATGATTSVEAKFVFIGAGGGALHLLQKSGIPEGRGFAGFPISGQFLRNTDPSVVERHLAKVYGQASVGAPPMSVPHLDTRYVDGNRALLFGPFAGFSSKYLKTGSYLDLVTSVRGNNLVPMLAVGASNLDLLKYLIGELMKSRSAKVDSLEVFYPEAIGSQWELITAGQRVQVIKKDAKHGGVLQFGTELITSQDGSLAALLGASPGASTAAPVMLELLKRSFGQKFESWLPKIREIVPSYGHELNEDAALRTEVIDRTNASLQLL